MEIIFYETKSDKIPVDEFILKLSKIDRAKVLSCLVSIEELGFDCPRVKFRQLKGKLWEIKIKAHDGSYRTFYISLSYGKLILLHAYKKQSQKAPLKELDIAEKRMVEVLNDSSSYT